VAATADTPSEESGFASSLLPCTMISSVVALLFSRGGREAGNVVFLVTTPEEAQGVVARPEKDVDCRSFRTRTHILEINL